MPQDVNDQASINEQRIVKRGRGSFREWLASEGLQEMEKGWIAGTLGMVPLFGEPVFCFQPVEAGQRWTAKLAGPLDKWGLVCWQLAQCS